jgi:hypothetical protein
MNLQQKIKQGLEELKEKTIFILYQKGLSEIEAIHFYQEVKSFLLSQQIALLEGVVEGLEEEDDTNVDYSITYGDTNHRLSSVRYGKNELRKEIKADLQRQIKEIKEI